MNGFNAGDLVDQQGESTIFVQLLVRLSLSLCLSVSVCVWTDRWPTGFG